MLYNMVKKIILKEQTPQIINISEINEEFCGVIICYDYNNIPVGFIVFDDPDWIFYKSINIQGCEHFNSNLSLLIKDLQSEGINKFEAIVFNG